MTSENKDIEQQIWESKPVPKLSVVASFEEAEADLEPSPVPRKRGWRTSVLVVATSLIAFTVGAGLANLKGPSPVFPVSTLDINNADEPVTSAAPAQDREAPVAKKKQGDNKKVAAAPKPRHNRPVGSRSGSETNSRASVAVAAAPSAPAGPVVINRRESRSGSNVRLLTRDSKPSGSTGSTPSQEQQSPPQDDSAYQPENTSDESDPDSTDEPSEPDQTAEETQEPEDTGPGNSENSRGHNK